MHVAVVGTGHWGKNHVRTLTGLREAGLVAEVTVCDKDAARARAMGADYGCSWSTEFEALLRGEGVDAITLATPTPLHHPMAKQCLQAGKHVLVEKPMATTVDECAELVTLATEENLTLMPGHLFRYHSAVAALRDRVATGGLGDILHIDVVRKDFRAARPDMGALMALGIHELDLFPHLLQEQPVAVLCVQTTNHRPGIDESARLLFRFASGALGHAWESWISPEGRQRTLTVTGSKATAHVDFMVHDRFQVVPAGVRQESGDVVAFREATQDVEVEPVAPLEAEMTDFVRCSQVPGRMPRADGQAGLEAVRLAVAAAHSAANDEWVAP